jgi:hypothetical protein
MLEDACKGGGARGWGARVGREGGARGWGFAKKKGGVEPP